MLSPVEALERFEWCFSLFFFQKQNLVFEQPIFFFEIFFPYNNIPVGFICIWSKALCFFYNMLYEVNTI